MKLILIHENIESDELLIQSFNSDCIIRKMSDYNTFDDLITSIDLSGITHLAFVYKFWGEFNIPFFDSSKKSKYDYFNQDIITLFNLFKEQNQDFIVDMITCNLNSESFIESVNNIESELGINIRYSIDQTGNNPEGNWVLESDNVNIKNDYFNENINDWYGILDINGVTFPPSGLTSNYTLLKNKTFGNGYYDISASIEGNGTKGYYLFDGTGLNWENDTQWVYNFDSYSGSTKTTVDGVDVYGEWVQIKLPVHLLISSYTLTNSGDSASLPVSWKLAGSNNGTTWYTLSTISSNASSVNAVRPFTVSGITTSYMYFRIIFRGINASSNFVRAAELSLTGNVIVGTPKLNLCIQNKISTSGTETVGGVVVDLSGYSYVLCSTDGLFTGQSDKPLDDLLMHKIDKNGTIIWTKQSTISSNGADYLSSIAIDSSNNIIFGSIISDGAAIDGQSSTGGNDVSIFKMDSDGNVIWKHQDSSFNTNSLDYYPKYATDLSNYAYMIFQTDLGGGIFAPRIAKFSNSLQGNNMWAKTITITDASSTGTFGIGYGFYQNIAVSDTGTIYFAFTNYALQTGNIAPPFPTGNVGKIFVGKLDTNGNKVWIKQNIDFNVNIIGDSYNSSICLDASENIYCAYYSSGDISGQTTSGLNDIILFKLDPSGNLQWTKQHSTLNTTTNDQKGQMIYDRYYNELILVYETNAAVNGGVNKGGSDIVLARINSSNGNLINTYQDTLLNTSGNDTSPFIGTNHQGSLSIAYATSGITYNNSNVGGTDMVFSTFAPVSSAPTNIVYNSPLLSWTAPSDFTSTNSIGYRIRLYDGSSYPIIATTSDLSYNISANLSAGTNVLQVRSYNNFGESYDISGQISIKVPTAPSGLSVTSYTSTSVSLTWSVPSNCVAADISSYTI